MPKKICNQVGCHAIINITERYCSNHKATVEKNVNTRNRNYDLKYRNKKHDKFYHSKEWKVVRKSIMQKHGGLCIECIKRDMTIKADVVDHIIPLEIEWELRVSKSNLQPLCYKCHNIKTNEDKQKFNSKIEFIPKILLKPKIEVTIVCGCIGSGKSRYVSENANAKDLIIDLDVIRANITKKQIYKWDENEGVKEAIDKRNNILNSLSHDDIQTKYKKVWLIISSPDAMIREWWAYKLEANIIFISATKEQCIVNIKQDKRRSHNQQYHLDLVTKWFRKFSKSHRDECYDGGRV